MQTFQKVREILVDMLDVDDADVAMDVGFDSLNMDSLDLVEFVMDCEMEFGITIADEDRVNCRSVGDWVVMVDRLRGVAPGDG